MVRNEPLGPDLEKLYTYLELPIGSTAIGIDPVGRRTGLWRFNRPYFLEKIPPCQKACPLENWIPKVLAEVAAGNLEEAWEMLRLENPFPGVCGRVCFCPCEENCNRKEAGGTVSIRLLERFLADHLWSRGIPLRRHRPAQQKKIAIVGSGPAGLAFAYFMARMGYETTVFEARPSLGGIPRSGIPDYRLPKKVLDREIQDILSLGVGVKKGRRLGDNLSLQEILAFDGVFLATGASLEKPLNIPGETLKGVTRGWDFLMSRNGSEPMPSRKKVLVIGGGNVAIDVTRSLIRSGCTPAVLYRRSREEMPASPEEVEGALEEGARIQFLLAPLAIAQAGKKGLRLECQKMELKDADESGRPRPVPVAGAKEYFEANQIIIATGEKADLSYLSKEFRLQKESLWVNEWGQTSVRHVFAGGDMVDIPRTVSHAIGSAKRAAIAMDFLLQGGNLSESSLLPSSMREHLGLVKHPFERVQETVKLEDLNLTYCLPDAPVSAKRISLEQRRTSFREVNEGLSKEEALQGAQRCLSCGICKGCGNCYLFCPDGACRLSAEKGVYEINYDYCKGCGICQNECPVGAIQSRTEKEG